MLKSTRLNIQICLLFFLAFVVLFANILLGVYYKNTRSKIKATFIHELKTEYEIVMGVYSDLSDFIYHFHINTAPVKELFAKGVHSDRPNEKDRYRKLLFHKLSGLYQLLCKYNFRQLHFHEKNNKSYLRFHRPEKYGDDLTKVRFSVAYVNKEKKCIFGFEEGRIFNGYRFVYPVAFNSEHIGSVEVSVSMKTVVDQLMKRFNQQSQFIILKSQVEKKVFKKERSNYTPWFVDNAYMLDTALENESILKNKITPKDTLKIKKAIAENKTGKKPFCVEIEFNSEQKIITFWPVINFQGRNVAYLFALFDGRDLKNFDINYYFISSVMLTLFVFLILFTVYYRFSQKKIQRLATYDSLTNVFVRGVIMQLIKKEYEKYQRYQTPFSLIMVDIDHFKNINDSYGHAAGDVVLSGIAQIMKNNIRKTDDIGRYGGEEFIILLPETNGEKAAIVAEKLRQKISAHDFHKIGEVTMSSGVSETSRHIKSAEDLIKTADKKMYEAKRNGRNRVVC